MRLLAWLLLLPFVLLSWLMLVVVVATVLDAGS